jgi:hypothetical protein
MSRAQIAWISESVSFYISGEVYAMLRKIMFRDFLLVLIGNTCLMFTWYGGDVEHCKSRGVMSLK